MDIGKKIKELRCAKLMTQTELAGDEITRNMLSRIENGAALPSIGTVIYLAERLGVHPGLLLADGDDDLVFLKSNSLKNIKKAFLDKNYELCRDMCLELLRYGDDDEIYLILTEATFECAEIKLLEGKLHKCKKLLDDALEYANKTVYNTKLIENCVKSLFFHIRGISPSLDSDSIDCQRLDETTKGISQANELCRYINLLYSCNHSDKEVNIDDYTICVFNTELYNVHIQAKLHMQNNNYEEALELLLSIVNYKGVPPLFVVYLVSLDIEICARELNDYKTAYGCSVNRISLIETMLSEV